MVLKSLSCAVVATALPSTLRAAAAAGASAKPLNGLFPIGQTPFTQDDKLDLDALTSQVRFCNRGRVPGFIWPQIASGWSTLSAEERFSGTEAILADGKHGRTALVIGVQTKGNDLSGAIAFAKHAAKNGADAICSLPPDGSDADILSYYKSIGAATDLPLFVQTIGNMSVDLVVQMFQSIPTMRVVKDEAGDPLQRVTELRQKTGGKLAVFAGKGVRLMVDEMQLGFTGFCPVVALADVYQQAWELYKQGRKREAFDMFGRILAFDSITNADQYLTVARGIFKEDVKFRPTPGMGEGRAKQPPLTDAEKQAVRDDLNTYLEPYLLG